MIGRRNFCMCHHIYNYFFLKLIKRYLKQEDTNSSYGDPKQQGIKRHPDEKKGEAKPPTLSTPSDISDHSTLVGQLNDASV